MKKYKKVIMRRQFVASIINPIFILAYWILFYELYTLCKFGRMNNNIIIIIGCMVFFLAWFVILIIKIMKKQKNVPGQIVESYELDEFGIEVLQGEEKEFKVYFTNIKSFRINKKYAFIVLKNKDVLIIDMKNKTNEEIYRMKKVFNTKVKEYPLYKVIWTYIAIIAIVFVTVFYGVKIYKSSINYSGKLSWVLKDLKDKKTVTLDHNNIYENGIDGIFQDIEKKIDMPDKLYISNNFSLNFDSDGNITSFDTFIYGKDDKDELKSYLISYDAGKSNKITIYLNGQVNADYSEDMLLEPLIDTMKVIPLKETVSNWNESKYGIVYYGRRSFGYNSKGIVNIDSEGNTISTINSYSQAIGYYVSVYVPDKENVYTPVRYNLVQDSDSTKSTEYSKESEKKESSGKSSNGTDEFYLSDEIGYRLEVTAAAAGSRSYSLNKTTDGGESWSVINGDPFSGKIGVAEGITFLDEKLGFLCLSHSGGAYGELYRTEDGGLTFKKLDFPEVKVTLSGTETYNPFDLPGMPYEKDGCINVLIGQGADGDYNGGIKALYQSKDQGQTWQYVKETNTED